MTLLEIQLTIQQIFQLLGKPLEMSLEQYNNYLRMAQDELFKEFAHGYMSGNGVEVDNRTRLALAPFKRDEALSGSFGAYGGLSCHVYSYNSSAYMILAAYVYGTGSPPSLTKKIDIILENELSDRLQNAITYPQADYPIGIVLPYSNQIYLLPQQSSHPNVGITYLSKPTTPALVETISNGVRLQDASSVSLEIDSIFHADVIRKILQYLGVSIGNEFIATVAQQQQNLEK